MDEEITVTGRIDSFLEFIAQLPVLKPKKIVLGLKAFSSAVMENARLPSGYVFVSHFDPTWYWRGLPVKCDPLGDTNSVNIETETTSEAHQ